MHDFIVLIQIKTASFNVVFSIKLPFNFQNFFSYTYMEKGDGDRESAESSSIESSSFAEFSSGGLPNG